MNYFEHGIQFYVDKQYASARDCFLKAIECEDNNYITYHNLGITCIQLGLNEEALQYLEIPCSYNYTDSYISRGAAFRNLGRYHESLRDFAMAFVLDPNSAVAYSNYSNVLREFGKPDIALHFIKLANFLKPDNVSLLNESITYLSMGNLSEGWKKYDYRWFYETGSSLKPNLPGPEYNGTQDLTNKVVLVYCEQGFGDCIQFARYLTILENLNAIVVLVSKNELNTLFQYNYPNIKIVPIGEPIPPYDYHVALLDLPRCFDTTIDTIPSPNAYLTVDENLRTYWRTVLGPKTKFRIGVNWTSNGIAYNTKFRKIDLNTLSKIFSDDFQFISLHFDPSEEEKRILERFNVSNFDSQLGDFYHTSGLISNLDYVITVDTVTAHLAGALGVPTIVMLNNYGCDWRWFYDREDSPFYNSIRLVRKTSDSWESVISPINQVLKNLVDNKY